MDELPECPTDIASGARLIANTNPRRWDVGSGVKTYEERRGRVQPFSIIGVKAKFDTDHLEVDLSAFATGVAPRVPVIEVEN